MALTKKELDYIEEEAFNALLGCKSTIFKIRNFIIARSLLVPTQLKLVLGCINQLPLVVVSTIAKVFVLQVLVLVTQQRISFAAILIFVAIGRVVSLIGLSIATLNRKKHLKTVIKSKDVYCYSFTCSYKANCYSPTCVRNKSFLR